MIPGGNGTYQDDTGGGIIHPPIYVDPNGDIKTGPVIEPYPGPIKQSPIIYSGPLPPVSPGGSGSTVVIEKPPAPETKNILPVILIGGVILLSMQQRRRVSGLPSWIIPAGIAAAAFLFMKKSKSGPGPAQHIPNEAEKAAYDELAAILEADSVLQSKGFPSDFYDAVKTEQASPGTYNDNAGYQYKTKGWPGAFMAVADAWQTAMGFTEETHNKLWQRFSKWVADSTRTI